MNNNFKIIFKKFLNEIKQTAVVVLVFIQIFGRVFSKIRSRKVGKKTAGKSEGGFTWKLGFQISPASKWGEMMRKVGVMGTSEVGLPKIDIRKFTKWDFVKIGLNKMKKFPIKNLIKLSVVSIVAVVGLFAFSRGAEAAFSCTG